MILNILLDIRCKRSFRHKAIEYNKYPRLLQEVGDMVWRSIHHNAIAFMSGDILRW
jgi:hypothetical protein